jgi:pimeloyl-ACP methyl ester carboxylesterase
MLIILSILFIFILILLGTLLAFSPGKVSTIRDKDGQPVAGSISEKVFVDINGISQGMFIKSKNADNPVLLYLHGGMPDYFLTRKYPTGLENLFTVVWWEQRGSGLSYNANLARESLTLEQMKSDTKEVTNYLRKRFGKEKTYLMGHSGGTYIGIQVAAESPGLYHAYIGVAQMSNQLNSEVMAYEYMLKKFTEAGKTKYLRKLEDAPVTLKGVTPDAYRRLRDPAMHSLGIGTTHDMKSVITWIFLPSLFCREYTFREKLNTWIGKSRSGISILWDEMQATDLSLKITELTIPVYFFEGIYDYTCSSVEAKAYFDKLAAPVKGFYTFSKSAHSPLFEEPEKMRHILSRDVLNGTNSHADAP